MILIDTEGTKLLEPVLVPLAQQPYMVEVALIKVDSDDPVKERDRLVTLVRPPVPLPEEFTKITGITESMLDGAPTFAEVYPKLWHFFLGETVLCGHNIMYDGMVLRYELARKDWMMRFPWPVRWVDTVEVCMFKDPDGKFLPQGDLLEKLTGERPKVEHRAGPDVESLHKIVAVLASQGEWPKVAP